MDSDVDLIWDFLKHIFPEFTICHAQVYKYLWRVDPRPVEDIVEGTGVSRTTVYKVLHELAIAGLVNRTSFNPVGYYAANPLKSYACSAKRVIAKLENGKQKLGAILHNSQSLSGEVYLVRKNGGKQKLVLKHGRPAIPGTQELVQIKRLAEEQIREIEKTKTKAWAVYR